MKLTCDPDGTYYCVDSYAEKETVKAAGFRFDWERKRWWTRDRAAAERLKQYADAKAVERLGLEDGAEEAARQASRALDSNIDIPCPPGKQYRGYQRAYVSYSMSREDILCGDEPGLGKTIESIALLNKKHLGSVLVVCPAIVKENWRREMLAWLCDGQTVGVVWPGSPFFPRIADVVIINYDLLHKHHDELRARKWDSMIVDECHAIKGDTIRTSQILGKRKYDPVMRTSSWEPKPIMAKIRQFLSGTPMMNRPAELWNILHSCGVATNWMEYHKRYAGLHKTRFGYDRSGATNLLELNELLCRTIMIRRLKRDVLKELPPKTTQMVYLSDLDNDLFDSELREYEHGEDLRARLRSLRTESFPTVAEYKLAVEQLTDSVQSSFSELARLRKETGLNKMPKAIEYARNILDSGEQKLVLFAHHRDVVLGLAEGLKEYGAKVLIGGMADPERQRAIDAFQQEDGCRVIVCSMKAAGVGITLTAASVAVFVEFDYTPGTIDQSADRIHRIGQEQPVFLHYLVKDGSLDARMLQRMAEKQQTIGLVMDAGV